jgi:hypothetical protein
MEEHCLPKTEIFALSDSMAYNSPTFAVPQKSGTPEKFSLNQKFIKMANKVNVTPLHDRVIVKPAAAEEKTAVTPVWSMWATKT